jgi:hypothetical protein
MTQCIFVIESNNPIVIFPMYLNYNKNAYLVILYHIKVRGNYIFPSSTTIHCQYAP